MKNKNYAVIGVLLFFAGMALTVIVIFQFQQKEQVEKKTNAKRDEIVEIKSLVGKTVSFAFEQQGYRFKGSYEVLEEPPGNPAHIAVKQSKDEWLVLSIARSDELYSQVGQWKWKDLEQQAIILARLVSNETYERAGFWHR